VFCIGFSFVRNDRQHLTLVAECFECRDARKEAAYLTYVSARGDVYLVFVSFAITSTGPLALLRCCRRGRAADVGRYRLTGKQGHNHNAGISDFVVVLQRRPGLGVRGG